MKQNEQIRCNRACTKNLFTNTSRISTGKCSLQILHKCRLIVHCARDLLSKRLAASEGPGFLFGTNYYCEMILNGLSMRREQPHQTGFDSSFSYERSAALFVWLISTAELQGNNRNNPYLAAHALYMQCHPVSWAGF